MNIHLVHLLVLLSFLLLLRTSGGAVPQCVVDRGYANESSLSVEVLHSENNATYLCDASMLEEWYDPSMIACGQDGGGKSPYVSAFECPAGNELKCVLFAGWGSVAGSCTSCENSCSGGLAGDESCCGKACTADTSACQAFTWISGVTDDLCGNAGSDGYCSCCPDCATCGGSSVDDSAEECVCQPMCSDSGGCYEVSGGEQCQDGGGPTNLCGSTCEACPSHVGNGIDESFCDCRSGLSMSADYAPCWNSCMDCFGDSKNRPDDVILYPPQNLIAGNCLQQGSCYIGTLRNPDGTVNWATCNSEDATTCVPTGDALELNDDAKFKGLFLCGAP